MRGLYLVYTRLFNSFLKLCNEVAFFSSRSRLLKSIDA